MELAVLLTQHESSIVEHGTSGELDYDNLIIRLRRLVNGMDSDKDPHVIGLDEDNELYEIIIPDDA